MLANIFETIIDGIVQIIIAIFAVIVWLLIFVAMLIMPNPAEPEITYGEFPFSITYEVDGEVKVYEDAIICEYEGIENLGTAGKIRQWKSRYKSGNESIVIFEEDSIQIEVGFSRTPEYFMGDTEESRFIDEDEVNDISRFVFFVEDINGETVISAKELYDKYKVKILDAQFAEPIENVFS